MSTAIKTIERKPREASPRPPLLLLLHGYGASEHDLFDLADYVDPHLHVLSLRAPLALPWGGFAWYHLDGVPGRLIPDPLSRAEAIDLLERIVTALPAQVGADPQRVYLLGFSQGAILSLGLAMRRPDLVAGVIAASGYLDRELLPTPIPAGLAGLPILQMHGTYDDVIPVSAAHTTRSMLADLPVRHSYHEYPVGHGIHPEGLQVLQRWLEERLAESQP